MNLSTIIENIQDENADINYWFKRFLNYVPSDSHAQESIEDRIREKVRSYIYSIDREDDVDEYDCDNIFQNIMEYLLNKFLGTGAAHNATQFDAEGKTDKQILKYLFQEYDPEDGIMNPIQAMVHKYIFEFIDHGYRYQGEKIRPGSNVSIVNDPEEEGVHIEKLSPLEEVDGFSDFSLSHTTENWMASNSNYLSPEDIYFGKLNEETQYKDLWDQIRSELTDRQFEVFNRAVVQKEKTKKVASDLNISEQMVRRHKNAALNKLKKVLGKNF